jgi:3-oxoacyl-[acyl-carrier-protein] synthase II
MIAGGASSQMSPTDWLHRYVMGLHSPRHAPADRVMRPFDAGHDGQVWGEGATVFTLENRRHAEARGAPTIARLLGWAVANEPASRSGQLQGESIRRTIRTAMERSGLKAAGLGHVNAHGVSSPSEDRIEAQAIRDVLPTVPVTAPKSYFGNLGAAGAATEIAASVLSFCEGLVPPTLNYEQPDPECPIEVIHGEPWQAGVQTALSVTWLPAGQAAAVVLAGRE